MREGPEKEAAMNSTLQYRVQLKRKEDEEKAKLEKQFQDLCEMDEEGRSEARKKEAKEAETVKEADRKFREMT
jgi:hypothetical protein